jgi:hypothetical protein
VDSGGEEVEALWPWTPELKLLFPGNQNSTAEFAGELRS